MNFKKLNKWVSTGVDKKEDVWQLHFVQLVLLTTFLRLVFALFAELKYEEAYYWCYGANLSLSYFDHPPMVGWLIRLFSSMGGQPELLTRVPTILLFAVTLTVMFRLTTRMFSSKVGFIACTVACCLPTFEWYSMLAMPDAPLMTCWILGMYWGYRLVTEERSSFWWLVGVATGLGMLSKYPAALIPLAPVLYLIWNRRWKLIFNVHFFGAALLALGIFTPVIVWNAQHEWCSFLFQGVSRFGEANSFLDRFGGTWLNQVLMLSPGGIILVIWTLVVAWKRREEQGVRFLICASYPFLILMVVVSCLRLVQMNWPLPGYIAAVILVASELERRELLKRRKILMALVFLPAILVSAMPLIGTMFAIGALNRANEFKGWREIGNVVMDDIMKLPHPESAFIIGNGYQIASETAFYTQRPDIVFCTNALGDTKDSKGYRYWRNPDEFIGQDAIIITYDELRSNGDWRERRKFDLSEVEPHFESVVKGDKLTAFYGGKPLRRYRIYFGHNYLGSQVPSQATQPTATAQPTTADNPSATAQPTTAEQPAATAQPTTAEQPAPTVQPATAEQPAATVQPATAEQPAATAQPTTAEQPAQATKPEASEQPTSASSQK